MYCANDKGRKTFENVRRLAELSHEISGKNYVIYKEEDGLFWFVEEDCFNEEKGERIVDVPEH